MKTSQTSPATPWRVRTGALLTGLALWCGALHAEPPSAQSVLELISLQRGSGVDEFGSSLQSWEELQKFLKKPEVQNLPVVLMLRPLLNETVRALQAGYPPEAMQDIQTAALRIMRAGFGLGASNALRVDMLQLYQKTYTQDEVDAWLAFLKTPAGASANAKQGLLMLQMAEVMQPHFEKLMPEVQRFATTMQAIEKKYAPQNAVPKNPS